MSIPGCQSVAKPHNTPAQRNAVVQSVLFDRLIFSSLLFLIGLAAVPFESIEPWWEGIFEGAIFILGVCCIATSISGSRWHVPALLAPLIGLIVFALLQTIPLGAANAGPHLSSVASQTISVDPIQTKRFVVKLLAVSLTLAMLLRYTSNRKHLLALAHLVIVVGAASAAFAIWRKLWPPTEVATLWNSELQVESFGQFMNRNHFALLMEMSLGVALGLASYSGYGFKRYLYAAVAILVCVALVLANSRGGIISMLGQFAFLSWIYLSWVLAGPSREKVRATDRSHGPFRSSSRMLALRCVLILLLLGVAFNGVLWLGGEPVRRRLESVPGEFLARRTDVEEGSPRRLEIWTSTLKLIEAHPLLGSGLGAYETAIIKYLPASKNWQPQQAHNEYLELGAGGGLMGGVLGIWFVLILIRETRGRLHETDSLRRSVCLGALAGLVGVAIHSLVDFGLHVMVNALICCGLVALATARSAPVESRSSAT